ncbi:hypothetical protein [Haloprofundus halobius]|uniref:hypothetical protein n=1 Tax=Haloprofundus halobius TaxID=2876194 RepID=UPI001CCD3F4D|nr:hypothetical protein [Haloprofundus halobius]
MDESRLWGGIGILIALGGIGVMATDGEFVDHLMSGSVGEPLVLYGIGVILAGLFTMLIIGPSMLRSR